MHTLREYQSQAVEAVFKEWEEHRATLIVCPTGTGKTEIFCEIIRRMLPRRSLVIAHREELIFQARNRIMDVAGVDGEIEMGDMHARIDHLWRSPVVISTVQTQNAPWGVHKRMARFKPDDFGLLVIDECFPKGTLIDGLPIESFRPGDQVLTHRGVGSVKRVFSRSTNAICRVRFKGGRELICTPNHPIWTVRGFIMAGHLLWGDLIATITKYESMYHLQSKHSGPQNDLRSTGMQVATLKKHNRCVIPETRRTDYSVPKNERDAQSPSESESLSEASRDGVGSDGSGRKRAWPHPPRGSVGAISGMELQCNRSDSGSDGWFSELLQTGRREFRFTDWGGDRWFFSLLDRETPSGQEEGGILEFNRVEGVEVYKQGSGLEFGRLCPEGAVYNLEVLGGATYFANGVLVHNCHHGTAQTYRNVIHYYRQNENLKVLGVTATPDRADEEALGQVFDTVAFDYEILDAIHGGWLVPVDQQFVHIDSLDFSKVRTTAGDLNGADLAAVMEEENNMQGVAGASLPIIGTRRSIVFTASVRQAEMLCNIYNRHRQGMADWVCGTTPQDDRRSMLKRFAEGNIQVVVNCGVLTEGFDNPGVEVIVMARPTKSRSLYAQMAGRSLRPLPGIVDAELDGNNRRALIAGSPKPSALILDFVGNSGRHKLITSADILGGKVCGAAIDRAIKKAQESGGPIRMDEALDEAEADIHEMMENARRRAEAEKAKIVAAVKYTQRQVNPFDVFGLMPVAQRGWDQGRQLSPKQRAVLAKQGINPDGMPYNQGRQLLLEIFHRWDNKLCSFKQANVLKRYAHVIGRDPKDKSLVNVSREEASQMIDRIAALQHWKPKPRPQKPAPAAVPF